MTLPIHAYVGENWVHVHRGDEHWTLCHADTFNERAGDWTVQRGTRWDYAPPPQWAVDAVPAEILLQVRLEAAT